MINKLDKVLLLNIIKIKINDIIRIKYILQNVNNQFEIYRNKY